MSSDRFSRQSRQGALMRLAARHQNSAIVLRRRPTDGKNGDSGPKLIPVYPTVNIRAGLGRSEKNVAKVNSTWTDTQRYTNSVDYAESDASSSVFNYDYEVHNGIRTLGHHNDSSSDRNYPHKVDMRDEEEERDHGHIAPCAMSSSVTSDTKLNKAKEALIFLSQKTRKGKKTQKTNNEISKTRKKSSIIIRKLQTLSCRNGINVIDGSDAQAKRIPNYNIQEEFSYSMEDSVGSETREGDMQASDSDDYRLPRNCADLSLYKYYAGETKKDTQVVEVNEIDDLVNRLRKSLKTKSG